MSERSGLCQAKMADAPLEPIGQGECGNNGAERAPPDGPRTELPAADKDLWLFGYGSLMWRPDLAFVERSRATVTGWHRAFCVASTHHRGTERRPGIVLGLDRGGACEGVAYCIAASDAAVTLAYLRRRELIYGVYREARVRAHLADGSGRQVAALAYIVERSHPSWLGRLTLIEQAMMIRGASGISGCNLDYLVNTVRHLGELGIRESGLVRLAALAAGYVLNIDPGRLTRPAASALAREWRRRPAPAQPLPLDQRRRFMHRARLAG